MYNFEPNEYLHVKLLEPLIDGQLYRFEVQARLLPSKCYGADFQNYVGVNFGAERISTHIPGDLFLEPHLRLKLPKGERMEWFTLVDTFTANGGETYLTLGFFPNLQGIERKEKAQEAFMDELERKYASQKDTTRKDMAWLYMSPDDQKKYLKDQKKAKNKSQGSSPSNRYKLPENGRSSDELQQKPAQRENISAEFKVRYYFDDFCLAAVPEDGGAVECAPETLPEPIEAGRTINLRNVFFDTGNADLKEESELQLQALYGLFERFPEMRIRIEGYTDNVGKDVDNLELSKARAEAVRTWLYEQGVSSGQLESAGFGATNPIETNDTEAGRARNRRVVFTILSL